jgi:D-aminoacyl-tRNA deacylase
MIGLLQRVSAASVQIDGSVMAAIETGLAVLIGVERGDDEAGADRLLERLLGYRVFADRNGKMNLSLREVSGGLLLVPQFTLAADTDSGARPSFTPAAPPQLGSRLFEYLVQQAHARHPVVGCGRFGVHMRVSIVNEGPVTFWLRVKPRALAGR